jgi:predicted kinase
VLIGIQGAGKSTYYTQQFAATHLRLNRDMLRTEHRLEVLFHAALAVKQSLVLDNTNPTRRARARWIASAKAAGYAVTAHWLDVPLPDALARNAAREGNARIPEIGIIGLAAKLEPPALDEGFEAIHRVRLIDRVFVVECLEDISHD